MVVPKTRIALLGADTLLGREVREALEKVQNLHVEHFAANGEANFGEEEGEAVYRQALTPEALSESQIVVVAGSEEGAKKTFDLFEATRRKALVIDCSGFLDSNTEARIVTGDKESYKGKLLVIPHPAAVALDQLLTILATQAQPVARIVVEAFEPASERGQAGLSELQQQTTALLSFRPLQKAVYDTQVSFAMVPRYGSQSRYQLEALESKIESHLATLLGARGETAALPMPSLRLIQSPVFHGYSFSLWVEFTRIPDVSALQQALIPSGIDVRTAEHEVPTNVGVTGQSDLAVGDIRQDRNNARALWLWAVADNLRITADRVVDLVMHAGPRL